MTLFTISCLDDQDSPYKFDVLITGRSGSSKSVLANGIFGGSLVTERHGVVTDSREENLQYYRATTDTHNVNVWISSGDLTEKKISYKS